MVKSGDIIGRPVVVREGGLRVGRVRDLVVDSSGNQVMAFILVEGLFKSTKVAPWAELATIGPDVLILNKPGSVLNVRKAQDIKLAMESGGNIKGLKLQTTSGKQLGKMEDFHFDEQTGRIVGYELSGGKIADTFGGRAFLPMPVSIELGKDVAFIAPDVESAITKLNKLN